MAKWLQALFVVVSCAACIDQSAFEIDITGAPEDDVSTPQPDVFVPLECEPACTDDRVCVDGGCDQVVSVHVGERHSCALLTSGRVACWGANDAGQLGDQTRQSRAVPLAVPGIDTADALALGAEHACARTAATTVTCWGSNDGSQLGNRGQGGWATFELGAPVEALVAAGRHTCVRLAGAAPEVKCWGLNHDQQLGPNPPDAIDTPTPLTFAFAPEGIAAGPNAVCAWTTDRMSCSGSPTLEVDGGPFQQVAVGDGFVCTLVDGTVACSGDPTVSEVPTELFEEIWAGPTFACGRKTTAESVVCWGQGVGSGDNDSISVRADGAAVLATTTQIAPGRNHSCALSSGGAATCWGERAYGKLGLGADVDRHTPELVGMPSGTQAMTRIQAGHAATCAFGPSQSRCWGRNGNQMLPGDGDQKPGIAIDPALGTLLGIGQETVCTLRQGSLVCSGAFSRLQAWTHAEVGVTDVGESGWACAAQADAPRALYCMGNNDSAQVSAPMGGTVSTLTERVAAGVVDVALGSRHGCVLRDVSGTQHVECWGDNDSEQVGSGGTSPAAPTPLPETEGATDLSVFEDHACAVVAGKVLCWGDNRGAHLRLPAGNLATPAEIPGIEGALRVATGRAHSCAGAGRDLTCWGDNGFGQAGAASRAFMAEPVLVHTFSGDILDLEAGTEHTCALIERDPGSGAGDVYCWGNRGSSRLGEADYDPTGAGAVISPF